MFKKKSLCVSLKIFFKQMGLFGFDGLNLCSSIPLYLLLYLQLNVYLVAICIITLRYDRNPE
jgi:hypothetical protein